MSLGSPKLRRARIREYKSYHLLTLNTIVEQDWINQCNNRVNKCCHKTAMKAFRSYHCLIAIERRKFQLRREPV